MLLCGVNLRDLHHIIFKGGQIGYLAGVIVTYDE